MEISETILSAAINAEVAEAGTSIGTAIINVGIEDPYLNDEGPQLVSNAAGMTKEIGSDRKKEMKPEIDGADARRDSLLNSIVFFLKGHIAWLDSAGSPIAEKLLRVIRSRGINITQESYEKETVLIDSILMEFATPENTEALATLNLSGLVAELVSTQSLFKELSVLSDLKESGKAENLVPTSVRKENLDHINTVITYINTMAIARPATYKPLALAVAEKAGALNTKIRTRIALNEKARKAEAAK